MPPLNLLHHAAARAYDGFPVLAAIEEARAAELAEPVEAYKASFGDYVAAIAPADFKFTRHTERLIEIGQRIVDGKLPRVMIELPPRHYKSTIFSRFLPGWFLRRFPERTFGLGAHTQTLAAEFGEAARGYFEASGGALCPSSSGKDRWKTSGGLGGMWVAGVGKGTGLPAHFLGVDDPIKGREEAESVAYRRRLCNWYSTVLNTREEPGCLKLITHTRWLHDADLIGWLLAKVDELDREGHGAMAERWHVISMPLIAEPIVKPLPALCTREPDHRKPGEALDPTRYDEEWAEAKKRNTPTRDWEALYQQNPSAGEGTVFFLDRMRFYGKPAWPGLPDDPQLPDRFIRTILSVDCTFDDTAGSDMVAMTLWGQNPQGAWLLDLVNERLDFPATVAMIRSMHTRHRFGELLIEKKANGAAVIKTLTQGAHGYHVVAAGVGDMGGKESRANAASVEFNNGRVFLPRNAPWSNVVRDQLLQFPAATFDDIVDSTSQLLIYIAGTGPISFSTVSYGHAAPGAIAPTVQW
jgi:hypothetical protein